MLLPVNPNRVYFGKSQGRGVKLWEQPHNSLRIDVEAVFDLTANDKHPEKTAKPPIKSNYSPLHAITTMRTKATFQIGDLVKLKSGGPLLTIAGYEESIYSNEKPNRRRFRCFWFDAKGVHHEATFPLESIAKEELTESKEPP